MIADRPAQTYRQPAIRFRPPTDHSLESTAHDQPPTQSLPRPALLPARGEALRPQRETAELLDLLIAERIVLLSSPSGAGKTSLVQAALIPVLEDEGFRVLPVMRPGLPDPT